LKPVLREREARDVRVFSSMGGGRREREGRGGVELDASSFLGSFDGELTWLI